jgi:hypothetical protein
MIRKRRPKEQLIEMLDEWQTAPENFQLIIARIDGAWDITLQQIDSVRASRGTGRTFHEAWHNMEPTHFQP